MLLLLRSDARFLPCTHQSASLVEPDTRSYCSCYQQIVCSHAHIAIRFKTVRKGFFQLLNSSEITVLILLQTISMVSNG